MASTFPRVMSGISVLVVFSFHCVSPAAVLTWDGSTGNWDTDASWLPGGVEPTLSDDVVISAGQVTVVAAGEVASTVKVNGSGELIVAGGNLVTATGVGAGLNINGDFSVITSGSVDTYQLRIGNVTDGHLLIDGGSSQVIVRSPSGSSAEVSIGFINNAVGTLDVTNGATFLYNPSTSDNIINIASDFNTGGPDLVADDGSRLTIDGVGSLVDLQDNRLDIGNLDDGHLRITNGGELRTTAAVIADEPTSGGSSVVVSGAGSIWGLSNGTVNGILDVGQKAPGTLLVEDGGVVSGGGFMVIATRQTPDGDSYATVTGASSRLEFLSDAAHIGGLDTGADGGVGHLSVLDGATAEFGALRIADNTVGTAGSSVTIDGPGSTLTVDGITSVGNHAQGSLIISNGGVFDANASAVYVGHNSNTDNSSVTVTGEGSQLNVGANLIISRFGTNNTVYADSGGDISVQGTTVIGQTTGKYGTLSVDGAGSTFTTDSLTVGLEGRGALTIANGGTAHVQGGSYAGVGDLAGSANSSIVVNGAGSLFSTDVSLIVGRNDVGSVLIENGATLAMGASLRIGQGGSATDSSVVITGAGSSATGGAADVGYGVPATLSIENGGSYAGTALTVGINAGVGVSSVNVDGSGSYAHFTGNADIRNAALVVSNSGVVDIDGDMDVRVNSASSSGRLVSVESGGTLNIGDDLILRSATTGPNGQLTVTGVGSSLHIAGGVTVGEAVDLDGELVIQQGGSAVVGSGIFIVDGVLTLDNASSLLSTARVSRAGTQSVFNWEGGTLEYTSQFDLVIDESEAAVLNNGSGPGQTPDDPGVAGNQADRLILTGSTGSGRSLIVADTTIIDGDKGVTISGGALRSGKIELIDGTMTSTKPLLFSTGTLELTNSGLTIGAGGILREAETALFGNKTLIVSGETVVDTGATLVLGYDNPLVMSATFVSNGLALLHGATVRNLLVPTNVSSGPVTASTLSLIDVMGGSSLTLGDINAPDGFYSNGRVRVGGNAVITLEDANAAVFDSGAIVTLGDDITQGRVNADNGIVLDFGGNIVGYGLVDTPNDPFKPLINNGSISGTSPVRPITLSGYIKGVGTLDNVIITGTDAPGFSPATVYRGSVSYAGTLEIELGGTGAGEFDRIVHSGLATLGGELQVLLINGFNPGAGDSFDILDWGTVGGGFASLNLPGLGGGLEWDTTGLAVDGTLSVVSAALEGDLNGDGFVGIADLNIVLGAWNQAVPPGDPLADPSGDGFVGIEDLNAVLGNWNTGVLPPAEVLALVPEPTVVCWLGVGLLGVMRRKLES